MKPKIAFIVQRYGLEVNGGAELHCRWLAEHMTKYWDIEVLTTKAIDHSTWKDEYNREEEIINGIKVKRFSVDKIRNNKKLLKLEKKIFRMIKYGIRNIKLEKKWIKELGPYSTDLFNYLKNHKDKYEFFIFFTALFATSYFGLNLVKEKSILVPTVHDEIQMYLKIFEDFFQKPRYIIFNTIEERRFVHRMYNNYDIPNSVIGIGVNLDVSRKKQNIKRLIKSNYILFAGRIEGGKNISELLEYFKLYKEKNKNNLKLVFIGKQLMEIPPIKDVEYLGFVSETEKYSLFKNALSIINPSIYESLSIIVLEAWKVRTPVIVNGKCKVTKGQVIRAQAGLWYENFNEFEGVINFLMKNDIVRKHMGENGYKYLKNNYDWKIIEQKYLNIYNELIKM